MLVSTPLALPAVALPANENIVELDDGELDFGLLSSVGTASNVASLGTASLFAPTLAGANSDSEAGEFDFASISAGSAAPDSESDGSLRSGPVAPATPPVATPPLPGAIVVVYKAKTVKQPLGIPGPKKRSAEDHAVLSRVMCDAKRIKALQSKNQEQASELVLLKEGLPDDCRGERSSRKQLEIAFASSNSITALAREHHCSRTHIRETIIAMGDCVVLSWMRLLERWWELTSSHRRRLKVFYDKLKSDESDQMLSLDVMDFLDRDQRRSKWTVCVQQRWVGWISTDDEEIDVAIPAAPTIMIGSHNAGCLYDALFKRKAFAYLYGFIRHMRSVAKDSTSIREADNASTVTKCFHHEQQTDHNDNAWSYLACQLHQTNLNVGIVCRAFLKSLIAAIFHHCSMLRTGNFWLRTVLSISVVSEKIVDILQCPPKDNHLAFWKVVESFFFPEEKMSKRSPKCKEHREEMRAEFRLLCNGPPPCLFRGQKGKFVHCCHPSWPCNCICAQHTNHRVRRLMYCLNYKARPNGPKITEWTRVSEALRRYGFNFLCGFELPLFYFSIGEIPAGTAHLPPPVSESGSSPSVSLDLVPAHNLQDRGEQGHQSAAFRQFVEETDWHRLNAKRVKATKAELMTERGAAECVNASLVISGVDLSSRWSFDQERGVREQGSTPPLFDAVWLERNCGVIVLQWYAAVLSLDHSVCQLLWLPRNCENVRVWEERCRQLPDADNDIRRVRCMWVLAGAWIHIRDIRRWLECWPWPLGGTADTRRPWQDRLEIMQRFFKGCRHCVDCGHGLYVKERIHAPEDLGLERWQVFHRFWAHRLLFIQSLRAFRRARIVWLVG